MELGARNAKGLRIVIIGGGATGLYAARELSMRGQDVLVIESAVWPWTVLCRRVTPRLASLTRGSAWAGPATWVAQRISGEVNSLNFSPPILRGGTGFRARSGRSAITRFRPLSAHLSNLGIPREFHEDRRVLHHADGSEPHLQEGLEVFLTRWLRIPSFSVAYAQEIETSENLAVLLNHTVVGFLGSNGVITAVRAIDGIGKMHLIEGDCSSWQQGRSKSADYCSTPLPRRGGTVRGDTMQMSAPSFKIIWSAGLQRLMFSTGVNSLTPSAPSSGQDISFSRNYD